MKIEGMLKKCGFAEQYLNISGNSQDAEKLLASSKKKKMKLMDMCKGGGCLLSASKQIMKLCTCDGIVNLARMNVVRNLTLNDDTYQQTKTSDHKVCGIKLIQ